MLPCLCIMYDFIRNIHSWQRFCTCFSLATNTQANVTCTCYHILTFSSLDFTCTFLFILIPYIYKLYWMTSVQLTWHNTKIAPPPDTCPLCITKETIVSMSTGICLLEYNHVHLSIGLTVLHILKNWAFRRHVNSSLWDKMKLCTSSCN